MTKFVSWINGVFIFNTDENLWRLNTYSSRIFILTNCYLSSNLLERDHCGSKCLMVWAGIMSNGHTSKLVFFLAKTLWVIWRVMIISVTLYSHNDFWKVWIFAWSIGQQISRPTPHRMFLETLKRTIGMQFTNARTTQDAV